MVAELTEPKMDWREIIQQQIMSTIKSDYTWMRPSRKSWHTSAILPGQNNDEMIDVCLALDASGSISDEQCKEFLTEVKNIMDQYKDFRIHLWTFDTEVFNPKVFTPDNADELLDYKLGSGGGTEFECNWEYMKENNINPKKLLTSSLKYGFLFGVILYGVYDLTAGSVFKKWDFKSARKFLKFAVIDLKVLFSAFNNKIIKIVKNKNHQCFLDNGTLVCPINFNRDGSSSFVPIDIVLLSKLDISKDIIFLQEGYF